MYEALISMVGHFRTSPLMLHRLPPLLPCCTHREARELNHPMGCAHPVECHSTLSRNYLTEQKPLFAYVRVGKWLIHQFSLGGGPILLYSQLHIKEITRYKLQHKKTTTLLSKQINSIQAVTFYTTQTVLVCIKTMMASCRSPIHCSRPRVFFLFSQSISFVHIRTLTAV